MCVIEKGAEVGTRHRVPTHHPQSSLPGAHILSGNVFEPRALDELLPNWKDLNPPTMQEVTRDRFYMLSERHARRNPVPPAMWNKGNYVVSLRYGANDLAILANHRLFHSQLVRWMAGQAEALGVEIYPGFAASEVLYDRHGAVCGVATNDVGIAKDGSRKPTFARGVELASKLTLFAEGARGSLSQVGVSRVYRYVHGCVVTCIHCCWCQRTAPLLVSTRCCTTLLHRRSCSGTTCGATATHRRMRSGSRRCGRSTRHATSRVRWCTPLAGRCRQTCMAGRGSTTWQMASCR